MNERYKEKKIKNFDKVKRRLEEKVRLNYGEAKIRINTNQEI
ncbi:MAG: hypothetical protein ACPLZ9_03870 [Candidatus Ratteibacteria bacterium]